MRYNMHKTRYDETLKALLHKSKGGLSQMKALLRKPKAYKRYATQNTSPRRINTF
jgi:hypothetical protein